MINYQSSYDDCLRCCVAGILDQPITDYPNFHVFLSDNEAWYQEFTTYMKYKKGIECLSMPPDHIVDVPTIGIMRKFDGRSHSVIIAANTEGRVIHDPSVDKPIYKELVAKIAMKKLPQKVDMSEHFKIDEDKGD